VSEPIIRVTDIAWIRLQTPDLDLQEQFLTDFGLARSERTSGALYMRGTDPQHHLHVSELGDQPRVLSIAFWAASEDDLHKLARAAEGASPVEEIDEPGGGKRVRLTEHNGFGIEVVFGVERVPALPVQVNTLNSGTAKQARAGELLRVETRPSQVKRIGHAVLSTPEVDKSVAWAHRHLGIIRSDDVHAEDDPNRLLASFNRIDAGDDYVDHHVMMFALHPNAGLNHVSFEVQDIDDLAVGHDFLKQRGRWRHVWGLGRHTLGSQIFDYWKDPWGRMHEHWTDSDVLNRHYGHRVHPRSKGLRSQWGPQAPQEFRDTASR
jgi:catechol 2,3-dioxygenase-like lactoylglutathione lyase family enzyme